MIFKKSECYVVIIEPKGHIYKSGRITPNYVTICKSPHWGEKEGIMITSGLHDATKFEPNYKYIEDILSYIKSRFPDRKFELVEVDKRLLGYPVGEVWSNLAVQCDFENTGIINGTVVSIVKK